MYVCDYDNNRIQTWAPCATSGDTIAGSSSATAGSSATLLKNPEDLVFDRNGFMYVADHNNHRVQRFPPNSSIGTTVAGTMTKTGALTDLDHLTSLAVDNNSNIYILDAHNDRVVEWAPNATSGTVLISSTILHDAHDILLAPGSTNRVYISDQANDKIYLWAFNAASPNLTLTAVNNTANVLKNPRGIVFDPYGNLYVADSGNNRVVMYCAGSTVGTVIAATTTPAITTPMAIALDSDLNLYVVSSGTDEVVVFPRR